MATSKKDNVADLKRFVREAAAIAKEAPENLQEAAFTTAFALLSGAAAPRPAATPASKRGRDAPRKEASPAEDGPGREEVVVAVCRAINECEEHDALAKHVLNTRSQSARVLMCLYFAHKADLGTLRTTDIESITEQLRVRVKAPNVRKVLREQIQRYVTQSGMRRTGQPTDYTISRAGEQAFDALLQGTKLGTSGGAKKTAKGAAKKTAKKTAKKPAGKPRLKRNGSRPSAKTLIEELLKKDFFKKRRTISELVEHLDAKRGHRFKANELSTTLVRMIRNEVLEREKNEDGQYEYAAR